MRVLIICLFLLIQNLGAADVLQTDHENIAEIPVTNRVRVPYVLYSIGPIDLLEGHIVDVRLQAVLTSECNGNIGIGRYIIRTKENFSVTGKRIVKTVMSNTTINDHHAVLVHSGIDVIKKSSKNNYYNFIVFAQSTQCEGKFLKVEGYTNDGFGEMVLITH